MLASVVNSARGCNTDLLVYSPRYEVLDIGSDQARLDIGQRRIPPILIIRIHLSVFPAFDCVFDPINAVVVLGHWRYSLVV